MIQSTAWQATTTNLGAIDVMALWQNAPNVPQAAVQVIVVSPLYAKYTSRETAPAVRIKDLILAFMMISKHN